MIELKKVCKTYKAKKTEDTVALNNITTKIPSKGLVFIVGTSGSGKSTLLNCIGGLDTIDSGSIIIDNIDITKLKEHELDKFRNSYLGFVFQDYNIIEDYNVFENINLSLELQGKKDDKLVSNTLTQLGLKGLEKRNINELSGGQKQRVAIARALIKNPSLILADEPTGNLDSKSSMQIFEILKNISENRTVLVVSHDIKMAQKYGDIIIEISDGKIVSKGNKDIKEEKNTNIELKQYRLSNKNILKLSLGNIKAKLGKFILTIILLGFSFFFLEFTFNIHLFKSSSLAYDTMHKNSEFSFNIKKENCTLEMDSVTCQKETLTEDDIKHIENVAHHKVNRIYSLIDGSFYLDFHRDNEVELNKYYESYVPKFVEIDEYAILSDLVGEKPKNKNEIVIGERKAEEICKYGITDKNGADYKPENLDTLIKDKKEVKFGNHIVTITGYIKLNDHALDEYKNQKTIDEEKSLNYFNNYIRENDNYYYVTKDFIDEIKLNIDYDEISKNTYFTTREFGEEKSLIGKEVKILDKEIKVLTREGEVTINSLKGNEIIMPSLAIEIYDPSYRGKQEEYYKNHPDLTYAESIKSYTIDYLNRKRFIDKKVYTKRFDGLPEQNVKIIGISNDDMIYVSKDLLDNYTGYNKTIIGTRLYENNKSKISYIFDNLELDSEDFYQDKVGEFYTIDYKYVGDIMGIKMLYDAFKGYIAVITAIFVLFAILLFYNFIATTITYSKKKIGILRAIGTTHKDVSKIFAYESLIIGVLSTILSTLIWLPVSNILNTVMNYDNIVNINHIVVEPLTIIITIISVVIGSLFLTSVCLSRLAHIKPIDAILDK